MSAPTWERTRRLVEREAVQRGRVFFWRENADLAAKIGDTARAEKWRRLARRAAKRAARLRRAAVANG